MTKTKRKPVLTPAKLRKARDKLGWTQQEMASKAGIAKITIARFETKPNDARLMPLYNDHLVNVLAQHGVSI